MNKSGSFTGAVMDEASTFIGAVFITAALAVVLRFAGQFLQAIG